PARAAHLPYTTLFRSVAFDTAGGQRQGVGHLLRSIALARQLRAMNADVRLVSPLKSVPPMVKRAMRTSGLHAPRSGRELPEVLRSESTRLNSSHQIIS